MDASQDPEMYLHGDDDEYTEEEEMDEVIIDPLLLATHPAPTSPPSTPSQSIPPAHAHS